MLLIKSGRVIDPKTKTDEVLDILIEDGLIKEIGQGIEEKETMEVINAKGLVVAPGFIDIHVHFRDPGYTYKEDLLTGAKVAARGGYTSVVNMANTNPVVDSVETIKYVEDKSKDACIEILQLAAATKSLNSEEKLNYKELIEAGAVGFSNDGIAIENANLLRDLLIELKEFGLSLSLHEEDPNLIETNGINKYSPRVAESSMVARDLAIAIETGGLVNIQHISSKLSVDLIREAKKHSNNIFAEVTPHHFSLTEDALDLYGPNAKMNPPLRNQEDIDAIIEGLKDGTIDAIATDHAPHSYEEKHGVDLDQAPSGIIGLETALSLAIMNLYDKGHMELIDIIEKLTLNPSKLYKLDRGSIGQGKRADICIFDKNEEYIYDKTYSKSFNSPFKNKKLKGLVKYTISQGKIVYKN